MANEIGIPSSVTPSSLQSSSKSGQSAAQVLSGTTEEQRVTAQDVKKQQEGQPGEKNVKQDVPQADIENEVQKLQEFSKLQGWTVNFSVEKDLDQVVIKVVDAETKSMIRQIPSEELLAISKRIKDLRESDATGGGSRAGLLLDNEI
ncbi:flagellar protein FlaG [Aeromonas hydrophila]|uniref:Flagellin protein n=1 Tax=Aeromonas hydrophila subsp. hydrophila (strain ATCC 7966 / DSM 30187 / BCRC 13018 / CCUG 14551 / JCM 1027 / KCTC 2358 / NCIMB 9240 / NCTC 8049) TaxID=380703 RepID=A0KIY5_AERHH|nr:MULTISPECIES: flagellar protein FlaG [Aeromonas]HDT5894245.1 flagellar protein FlaG [Aeromonas hydrophila subsp. hydrophila]ABK39270.1 flagellin protein [Aeromonas hydrophila subsp. hydrophila ATCC 7966]EZH80531.1 flagellin [Aeromonas hydrophila AD9]KHE16604.1 flagellin [Aeromonas hydrophila]MBS4670910.1 flagellar protein FlaG [Aeromonas hydrophila]